MNTQDRVLCSNLNELVKKMVLTFCEVNIKFSHHLDIYGSIHVRADDTDIASMLLNEHCVRDMNNTGSNSLHMSNDRGDPQAKENIISANMADQSFTKVIQSQSISHSPAVSIPSSAPLLQHRPLPTYNPPQQNMFGSPVFFDVCGNNMAPMPVNDPYRVMGFLPTPLPLTMDMRGTAPATDNLAPSNLMDHVPEAIHQLVNGETPTHDDTNHEMSATESGIPPPHTEGDSDLNNPDLLQWQQTESSPRNTNSVTMATGVGGGDSDSNHDTSSSSQGGGVTYRCRVCRQTFSDMKVYTHHVGQCKYKCDKCGRTFSMKQTLDTHLVDEHGICHGNNNKPAARGRYQCTMCDQNFKTKAALNSHVTFRHRH